MPYDPRTQAARFWKQVQRCEHGEPCQGCCWPWHGAQSEQGYGRTRFVLLGEEETYAHRIAFALWTKRLAGKKEVCHSCDNPPCCNPLHLWSGTHRANHGDSRRKGRRSRQSHPQKLTWGKVRDARRAWQQGQTQREIAATLGVSQPLVSMILQGKIWKELPQ